MPSTEKLFQGNCLVLTLTLGLLHLFSNSYIPFLTFQKKQLELQDKMDLASYLLKPVQRMGKYALLLKQLLKECPEREKEHKALKVCIK